MNVKQLIKETKEIEEIYKVLFVEFKNHKILKTKLNSYIKEDRESFLLLWEKYITLLKKTQFLIKKSKYRSFFIIINNDKLIIKRYLLIFYFNILVDLLDSFWKHEEFIRTFLDENFYYDYWKFSKYIYRPSFIGLLNTPSIFLNISKSTTSKEVHFMLNKEKHHFWRNKRVLTDYKNIYYFLKYRFLKILFFISKHIWNIIAKTNFSNRKKWLIQKENINKYLKKAKVGDIFLTRRNWNASNLTIPWFWKHMSVFLWKWKYIKKNYITDFKFLKNLKDNENYIIEAYSKWVQIITLDEFISNNDYLWISRTIFKKEKIDRVLNKLFQYYWVWYDYIFNFYSNNSVICSEIVLKSYAPDFEWDEWLQLQLKKIWVGLSYPPNDLINEIFSENSKIKPVFFIDTIEKKHFNFINTKSEFNKSKNRSRFSFMLD